MCNGNMKASSKRNDENGAMTTTTTKRRRRGKRDKHFEAYAPQQAKKTKKSKALQRHGKDSPSGGIESLIPSLIGVAV
eukprot:CAMPEP_0176015734 /NCGR_PEP_ID=MMETSP0120_2-20121206/7490_1 /TAXON_ID=160619 /ORGANISM="Kryptoperidinium foliaceum, Strain CCMP 1326" /LENGTH=77 /DNA_ID=CAMNT_0017348713 /DNA_START=53 /DNA_END=283 /DNA_ORIENTATION=-